MINVEKISKEFRSGRGLVNAVCNLSLTVPRGSILSVKGKSGSGKTTLLNCIGGLDRPEKGKVLISGTDIHSLSEKKLCLFQRKNMGFVFQHSNLLSYLSVFRNIAFPLELNGFNKKDIIMRVSGLLEMTGLKGFEKAMPEELSGGESQRVAFMRAIAHSPGVVLADEPTASLDSETGKELARLMTETGRNRKCSVVIATHDSNIANFADMKINMTDGKITGEG